MIIVVYRIGASIVVPYVDASKIASLTLSMSNGSAFGLLNTLSGGALANATLFALGVSPYITASIVMQLLTIAIPPLERMAKDEDGKKKINAITRYVTVALAIVTAFGYTQMLDRGTFTDVNGKPIQMLVSSVQSSMGHKVFAYFVIITCFCAGASLTMWIAEKINEHGIGNGISIILFANIISRLPSMFGQLIGMSSPALYNWLNNYTTEGAKKITLGGTITAVVILICVIGLLVLSVWFTNSERRIPIQYAKRVVGRKMYGGQGTHLPLKMNMAGVMPIIFASSIVTIPATIVQMFGIDTSKTFGWFVNTYLNTNTWTGILIYLILLVAFSYFYIMISFNPVEVANNIRNNGGAVPGIRPGRPTVDYIKKILNRITLIGAGFLAIVACVPMIAGLFSQNIASFAFGGSSLLIVVGVALETFHDIEAQLSMRNYKGFLD